MTENSATGQTVPSDPITHTGPAPGGALPGEASPSNLIFGLTVLGAGSATPSLLHHPTAQLLHYNGEYFLIDCGEGTQFRLLEQKIRPGRLRHIFISHLHGDHYFGLAPLLSTLNLGGRTDDLFLFGPAGLDDVLTTIFRQSDTRLGYPLHFTPVNPDHPTQLLTDHASLTVETIPLDHRIGCTGYLFREKPPRRKLLRDRLPDDAPIAWFNQLKDGRDILNEQDEVLFSVADCTVPGPPARSYAFCSDTRFDERIIPLVQGVDLLYHEATFLEDNAVRANEVYHSTARQAALIAVKAQVGRLLVGHFSSRYKETGPFLIEARPVFAETYLAEEGVYTEI